MDKERCAFEIEVSGKCLALTEKQCEGCNFYKTKGELEAGREKAAARVAELDPDLRQHIRHKYYGSRRAFKDET